MYVLYFHTFCNIYLFFILAAYFASETGEAEKRGLKAQRISQI